ncbi:myosin-2 essential light chain-like [Liolophura sinensis]|uniref:myosin-2 essential light chain-like n=1 Tax=Liolophura sinensis TaxID=3198878 RepID=UPI00315915EA
MSKISEDQIAEYQETFNLFDTRGDDKIEASQLGNVLRALNQNPTEAEVRKYGPKDPETRISFEQFLPIFQAIGKLKNPLGFEDFVEGFKVFDREQNGCIGCAEIRHLLTSLGERLTEDEVDQLLQGMEDKEGNVNYEEFIRMVMNG